MSGPGARRFMPTAGLVLALVGACGDPADPGPPPVGSVIQIVGSAPPASAMASASAAPRTPPVGCPKLAEALGLRRGFPMLAPQSKDDLKKAIAELDARTQAFEAVKAELDPESQAAGVALSGTFAEFAAMMRRKTPPPQASAKAGASALAAGEAGDGPAIPTAPPTAAPKPAAAPRPAGSGDLYDMSAWSEVNDRFAEAWKAASALCPPG